MRRFGHLAIALVGITLVGSGCVSSGRYTEKNNPTTKAGRGMPVLDDPHKAAAWILVDGREGVYRSDNETPLAQWFIEKPVSSTPTFRVEVLKKLLGKNVSAKFALQTIETKDGSHLYVGLSGNDGVFVVGEDISLTSPGNAITIRQAETASVLEKLEPLAPGKYALVGTIKSLDNDNEVIAATYFSVGG